MTVIGVVGRIGAGKDEVANYLRDTFGVANLSPGDVVRRLATDEGLSGTREDLQAIAERYRRQEGEGFAVRRLVEEIERTPDLNVVAISGIRTPADVHVLKDRLGYDFILVHVRVSDPHIRFERLQAREEPRDPDTFADFQNQDQQEDQRFRIDETIQSADVVVDNDGDVDDLHRQIDRKIVQRFLKGENRGPAS